jgi:hypothetical protein
MMRIALLAALLIPLSAIAQERTPPAPEPGMPDAAAPDATAPETKLPIGAMRHHQPTADDVRQREGQVEGDRAAQRGGTHDQHEVDDLYQEVMRRSAPPGGGAASSQH